MRRIKRALSSLGDAAWEWMNDHKYVSVFFSGVIIDFWANWYSYAIVHDWIIAGISRLLSTHLKFSIHPLVYR